MKNLFLLLGAPAIGKSTFIKKNALEAYTIEIDKLRDLFGSTKRVISDDNRTISVQTHDADQQVWDLAFNITEDRMSKGKTTIIDATFLFPSAFIKPFELAKKYNYKVVIIDFMADAVKKFNASYNHHEELLEHLIQNDQKRNQNIPEYVFERYIARYFDTLSVNNGTKITPSVFEKQYLSPLTPVDLNSFNRIKVIGDVHGDHSALMKVFDDHKRGDAYVFVGDYLDRGTKNVETFKFLSKLKGKNLFFLKGNHENHILHFVQNGKVTGRDFKTITLPELSAKTAIVAHNFTRDVFRSTHTGKSRWTPLTTSARGLFTRGQEVVGRGFPKFFTLAEVKTEDEDLSSFTYPVHAYHKWNGFLAIAFYTAEDGLIITNKSGIENSYNTIHLSNLVVDKTPRLKEKLTSFLSKHPTLSVTLEIIAPEENDKHIVVYSKDIAVPLSVIDNVSGDIVTDYDDLFDIKPVATLSNRQELNDFVNHVKRDETDLTEGYVLRGANGYQLKLKTPFYLRAKSVRGRLDKSVPLHNINKLSWPYGGKKWFIEAASNHIKFTPEWAEKMQLNK